MSSLGAEDDSHVKASTNQSFNKDVGFNSLLQRRVTRKAIERAALEQLAHDLLDTNNIRPFYDEHGLHIDDQLSALLEQLKLGLGPPKCALHTVWDSFVQNCEVTDPEAQVIVPEAGASQESRTLLEKIDMACRDRAQAIRSIVTSARTSGANRPFTRVGVPGKPSHAKAAWKPTTSPYGWITALNLNNEETEDSSMRHLQKTLDGVQKNIAFCCGGQVKMGRGDGDEVILHWDSEDHSSSERMSLPSPRFQEKQVKLERLKKACQIASFGRHGQDVIDESYRKAAKLDKSHFTTNWHPHDCGILDEIERCLLPSYLGRAATERLVGVRAELYKLNVYSAPHGHFKSHVDTPRSDKQFGSLVVCLPFSHKGGTLAVRKNDRSVTFDWGNLDPDTIGWASFYSDCEHEVLPLLDGDRLTLTYNLHVSDLHTVARPALEVSTLPLWHDMSMVLRQKGFLLAGGKIGIYCSHPYAHSVKSHSKLLPEALKGMDAISFAVLRSLGLTTHVLPVIRRTRDEEEEENEEEEEEDNEDKKSLAEEDVGDDQGVGPLARDAICNAYYNFQELSNPKRSEAYLDALIHHLHSAGEDFARRVARASNFPSKLDMVKTSLELPYFFDSVDRSSLKDRKGTYPVYVGHEFYPLQVSHEMHEGAGRITDIWGGEVVNDIHWINTLKHKEIALIYMTYGNEAELEYRYSNAAIVAEVPAWTPERGMGKPQVRNSGRHIGIPSTMSQAA